MHESVQVSVDEVADAYLDLANELRAVGCLLRRDDHGPAAPYHIFLIGSQFVVLKRYKSPQRDVEQLDQTAAVSITLGQDDAMGLALGLSHASTLVSRWMIHPTRIAGDHWGWQTSALPNSPVSSKELAQEIHRRLESQW